MKLIVTGWGATSLESEYINTNYYFLLKKFQNKSFINFHYCNKIKHSARQISNELLKTQLKTMPLDECDSRYYVYNLLVNLPTLRHGIDAGQYYAYDPDGRNDSCIGDSGGPLQFFRDENSSIGTVVGIVSFGIDCDTGLPGIYIRVAHYLDWIEAIVWP